MNKLPLKVKILFAIGGLGENITFQAMTAWLLFFWSSLIPIGLLGVLMGIGRFIEAFDDPIIGYVSDRTKSRWGRRFPYIFFGAPVLALTFFLLWIPVPNAIYFFVVLQLFFFAYTLVSAPYEGILPELAKTSTERVSTSAWRVLFGVIGAGLGLVGSGLIIQYFGFSAMGIILGVIGLFAFWICALGIKKRLLESKAQAQINLKQAMLSTLKNNQFLYFSLAFILFSLGLNLLTALLPFYTKIILGLSEAWVSLFIGVVLLAMLASLPLHQKLASLKSKKWAYSRSMLILSIIFPLVALVGLLQFASPIIELLIIMILIGSALAGQFVFPNAILADVIDFDETRTGLRREAIYYGMQNTLQKFSFAISSIIFGTTLTVFGATIDNPLGIRLIGPIAGVVTFLGFLIFIKGYKLPDRITGKINL